MANVRVTESSFVNRKKNIVAIPDHYVALPAQIAATNAVTEDGKKIIKAGTCVTNASSLTGRQTGLTPCAAGTMTFDGVIFNDVEVLTGETTVNVTVLIHGFVKYAALKPVVIATVPTVPTSKTDLIFVTK